MDPRWIVAQGYDRIAERYAVWAAAGADDPRERYLHFDAATNARLVEESGLCLLSARGETTDEDGTPVPFLWVVAERPGGGDEPGRASNQRA